VNTAPTNVKKKQLPLQRDKKSITETCTMQLDGATFVVYWT